MEQEAVLSIDEAFNEGYKQGLLNYAPDVEFWKTKATHLEQEIKRVKKDRWTFAFWGFGAGFLIGGIGLSIRIQN